MTMPGPGYYASPIGTPVLPTAPPPVPPLHGPWPPRQGEPGWTVWPHRVWPLDALARAPREFVLAAVGAGALGTALWRPSVLSVGYLVVGVVVFGVVYGMGGRRPTWLGVLCVMAAWLIGWCTLAGGRTWTAVVTAPFLPWLLSGRVTGWLRRAAPDVIPHRTALPSLGRAVAVVAITVGLVAVFGGLFAAADPAFAHVLGALVPDWGVGDVVARGLVFGAVTLLVLGGGYLTRFPPRLDAMAPAPRQPVPRWEWALPLGVLDALFVAFVAVQATVLFGGHSHVLGTDGLTYAEYARQGFWQLLWVSALTLMVIAVVIRVAGRATVADRRTLRILVGTVCAASVVVVISAIHRMWLYQQAFGFSVQRVMVIAIELWLGAVFVLVAVAGLRMAGRWLPWAVLVAGVVTLLGLAALNPERMIAERNIDRYERTGHLDAQYLLGLSSDVEPALRRLPTAIAECATYRVGDRGPWNEFNLSRWRATYDGSDATAGDCAQAGYES